MWQQRDLLIATIHFQMNPPWPELLTSLLKKENPNQVFFSEAKNGIPPPPPGPWWLWDTVSTRGLGMKQHLIPNRKCIPCGSAAQIRRAGAVSSATGRSLSFPFCFSPVGVTKDFAVHAYLCCHLSSVCTKGRLSHKLLCMAGEEGKWAGSESLGVWFGLFVCLLSPSLDLKHRFCLAREMTQWVKVLVAEPEDPSSIPEPVWWKERTVSHRYPLLAIYAPWRVHTHVPAHTGTSMQVE